MFSQRPDFWPDNRDERRDDLCLRLCLEWELKLVGREDATLLRVPARSSLAGGAQGQAAGGAGGGWSSQSGEAGDTDQHWGQSRTRHQGRLSEEHLPLLESPGGPHQSPGPLSSLTHHLHGMSTLTGLLLMLRNAGNVLYTDMEDC